MRIVSGFLKGRRFEMPSSKWKTRPTTDYAKESLFNILQHQIGFDGLEILDLFSGTGSIAYEFISRGAAVATVVDKFAPCLQFIKKQAAIFNIEEQLNYQKTDVFRFLQNHAQQYDIIFADPPYANPLYRQIPALVNRNKLLKKDGMLIIEHDSRQNFENDLNFTELRQYGQSFFSFFAEDNS